MKDWTVRDIRTGRAIGKTDQLTELFVFQIKHLISSDTEFYVVHGPCRHREMREVLDTLGEGIPVIYDRQIGSDLVYIFEGDPSELGFAL